MSVVAGTRQSVVEVPAPSVILPSPQIHGIEAPAKQKYPVVQVVDAASPLLGAYVPASVLLQIVFPREVEIIPQGHANASSAFAGQ